VCVCVRAIHGGGERTDENYDSDSLSKSMKTIYTTTTTTALLLLLLHPRIYIYIRVHIVCVGPICVIRPKGMCVVQAVPPSPRR